MTKTKVKKKEHYFCRATGRKTAKTKYTYLLTKRKETKTKKKEDSFLPSIPQTYITL